MDWLLEKLEKEVKDLQHQLQVVNKEVWEERKKFNTLIRIIEEMDGELLSLLGQKLQVELDEQQKEGGEDED